jgi:hypothetical protein
MQCKATNKPISYDGFHGLQFDEPSAKLERAFSVLFKSGLAASIYSPRHFVGMAADVLSPASRN